MLTHRNVLKIVFEIADEGLFSTLPFQLQYYVSKGTP
jgi:hypothetical protein